MPFYADDSARQAARAERRLEANRSVAARRTASVLLPLQPKHRGQERKRVANVLVPVLPYVAAGVFGVFVGDVELVEVGVELAVAGEDEVVFGAAVEAEGEFALAGWETEGGPGQSKTFDRAADGACFSSTSDSGRRGRAGR